MGERCTIGDRQNMRKIEEKHYFANRSQAAESYKDWMDDPKINLVWFTDRHWMKDDPKRYEVMIAWEEEI